MPRIVVFGAHVLRRASALGRKDIGTLCAKLARTEKLPGPEDFQGLLPPTRMAFVRQVPNRNVWLWYTFTAEQLRVVALTTQPPPDDL